MTPSERLTAALAGNSVDRMPVSLYEIDGFGNLYAPPHESYRNISTAARDRLDNMIMINPVIEGPLGFLFADAEEGMVTVDRSRDGAYEVETTTVRTPRGPLRMETRRSPDVYTVWTTEHLLKSGDDVDWLLSIPYRRGTVALPDFVRLRDSLDGRGVMMVDLPDPIGMVIYHMAFEAYLMLAVTDRVKFRMLLDSFAERILDVVDGVLALGGGPLFRIIGPEACTPPMMPPAMFEEFVTAYDRPIIERLHRAGCFARIHCHGRIREVAGHILAMEPDALDPVEEPPGGDITLPEAVSRFGGALALMGNIQEALFEQGTPDDVRCEVARVKEIGGRSGRFVLMPTATPITVPLPSRVEENLFAFVEEGLG